MESSAKPESRFSFQEEVLTFEDLTQVVQMMDGSNLAGLLRSWEALQPKILESTKKAKIPWNQHPVNIILIDKLSQLAQSDTGEACKALQWMSKQLSRMTEIPHEK